MPSLVRKWVSGKAIIAVERENTGERSNSVGAEPSFLSDAGFGGFTGLSVSVFLKRQ